MKKGFPIPVRDGDSEPYWEGIDNNELRVQKCQTCHQHVFYPRSVCPHCFSDQLQFVTVSGYGEIYSYTVVHRSFGPFTDDVPFVVAIVELAEGVRMMTRIKGRREQVEIGRRVKVAFEKIDDNLTLPFFEIVDEESTISTAER
ncbi:Zn-ribbon domain-containing OB-fold protein [Alicyclobacillus dauci]|uniref:Zn-ribbon domain-containing OB-fold protein n=1 Tax=Alicyclobacillus dauci TaxID=1475485 RepID=A0ABY6Z3R9_9BACL|nr:Zn-ribbon domain-containing OB-fold protein [Alicyclobacillus dauci]WAH37487.1 Zn-ribbon domain-containing OB-fold protein [Alicyclobacillus dauci]